jgi:hypothetical protein
LEGRVVGPEGGEKADFWHVDTISSLNSPHGAMGRMATSVASLTDAPQRRCQAAGPLLDVQQPALEARRHRFRAVGDFELQENGGDVLLDRVVKY